MLALPVPGCEEKTLQYERVAAQRIGRGRYRLLRSPNRVPGLAAGDVFALTRKEECGFRVVAPGGNVCVWFYFDARYDKDSPEAMELCRSVEALGGSVDAERVFSLTFTIPTSAGLAKIDELMRKTADRIPWSIYQYGSKPERMHLRARPSEGH
ncbi:MAG: DUF4265 domain-containing protein [Gammaproteobacteria bacterium]